MIAMDFHNKLLQWHRQYGRKNLPWKDRDHSWSREKRAYYTIVSEIMLQQTQANRVINYFQRFVERLPSLQELAAAESSVVLNLWQGLGYYRRAKYLHLSAQTICQRHDGILPTKVHELMALPGIGKSTAHAILAQTDNTALAILDANVIRVLSRLYAIENREQKRLWHIAQQLMPNNNAADYTQAIMDFGALVCKRKPECQRCFMQSDCLAFIQSRVAEFPVTKPIIKQEKRLFYPLITTENTIIMQRRNSYGIWADMWALPEFTSIADLARFVQSLHIGAHYTHRKKATWLLTHRRLTMHYIIIQAQNMCNTVAETNLVVLDKTQLEQLSIPTPFQTCIAQYANL